MIKNKIINKYIALTSAFVLTLSSVPIKSLAKDNSKNSDKEDIIIGAIAEPYIPDYVKLDKNKKPILDEDGNFIFINEKGDVIDSDILKEYTITANEDGEFISELASEESSKTQQSRSAKSKVVNINSVNVMIRSSKSATSTIVDKIKPNTVATVLENDNSSWYKVSYVNSSGVTKVGYSVKDGLVLVELKSDIEVKNISGANVNIRSTNSTSGSSLGLLPANGVAYAVNKKDGWIRIVYNNICGWVSESLVKFTDSKSSQSTNLTSGSLVQSVYGKNKTTTVNIKTSSNMLDSNGRHFYCMDPEKQSPNGHVYHRGKQLDDGAYRIIKNGYPNKSFTGDASTDRVITQIAFWAYVDKGNVDINNLQILKNNANNSDLLNKVKTLYNKSTTDKITQNVSIKFSTENLNANFKGNTFETDYITLIGEGNIKSATTTLNFYDKTSGNKVSNIKVLGEDNKELSSISIGQKFKISIPSSISSGDIVIKGFSTIDSEGLMFYTSNLAGVQDAATIETIRDEKEVTNKLYVSWKGVGALDITKTDSETKSKLAGAQYSIKDSTDKVVQTLTTDNNGYAKSQSLPFGTYKVQEVKAPTGYVLDNTVHTVNINTTSTVSLNYTNNPIKGNISITKVDADDKDKVLEGAEFTLYKEDNTEVAKTTTDKNGVATFSNIKYGNYLIKETKAPTNYELDSTTVHKVTISENSKTHTIIATNKLILGSVSIKKVDAEDENKVLEGAEFTLYKEDNTEVAKATTDKNGVATFSNIPCGNYLIKETKAPNHYELDSETTHKVTISNDTRTHTIIATNKLILGSVSIKKVDAEDENKVLEGAEFTLYKEDDTEVAKATTDKDGMASFDNLITGKYYIKETKAPELYVISDDIKNFEVTEKERTFTFTIKNSKSAGELDFSKVDVSTGDIIEGATIEITGLDETNNHIKFTFVSSKEGNRFKLPLGKYEFKETIAPNGYVLSTEVGTFEIKAHGEVVKAQLENKPMIGSVKVLKVDSKTKKSLTGAEFALYDENGKEVKKLEVDKDGVALFDNLKAGKYFIKETKAPVNYQISDKTFDAEITKDGDIIEIIVENDAKLAQTGGDYTFNQLIFTGSTLLAIGLILMRRNKGGKIYE